jgi:hypothetical protein
MKLAENAALAVKLGKFETRRNYCSRFCRQVTAYTFGNRFDHLFGGNAAETAHRFNEAGCIWKAGTIEIRPGDFLFKNHDGPPGHVGILTDTLLVAENSSTKIGRVRGALGFRTLHEFGHFDYVGRLPI